MAISRQNEARSRDYVLLLFRMTSRVIYSAQYYRQHCTLYAFEQFEALYMHNHDDKYPSRPGFEPGTPRLQAPVDTNEPSGPATHCILPVGWTKPIIGIKIKQRVQSEKKQETIKFILGVRKHAECQEYTRLYISL